MIVHRNELGDNIKGDGNGVLLVRVMRREVWPTSIRGGWDDKGFDSLGHIPCSADIANYAPTPSGKHVRPLESSHGSILSWTTRRCQDPSPNICFPYLVLSGLELAELVL